MNTTTETLALESEQPPEVVTSGGVGSGDWLASCFLFFCLMVGLIFGLLLGACRTEMTVRRPSAAIAKAKGEHEAQT